MAYKPKAFVLFLITIIFSFNSFCSEVDDFKFSHISTKEGLSYHIATCVIKDSRGFMWFGTRSGLNRYDGYNILVFSHNPSDSTSLSSDQISSILDHGRYLLVGTYDGGLNKFDPATGKCLHYRHNASDPYSISHDRINDIKKDAKGRIWIGTQNGLNFFDPENDIFYHYKPLAKPDESEKNQINAIYTDTSGIIWIGSRDGLFKFDTESCRFTDVEFIPQKNPISNQYKVINCITKDHEGTLWVGTDYLPIKINNGGQEWLDFSHPLRPSNIYIKDIAECNYKGNYSIWIATSWGLNRWDFKQANFAYIYSNQKNPNSISTNDNRAFYEDGNGLLWIAGFNGVDILNLKENPFRHIEIQPGKFKHSAVSFCEDKEGNFWVGSPNAGLLRYDRNFELKKRYQLELNDIPSKYNYSVFAIFEDSRDNLWIGINKPYTGIYIFDRKDQKFNKVPFDSGFNKHTGDINDILEDRNGVIWVATNMGLIRADPSAKKNIVLRESSNKTLLGCQVYNLFEDHNGVLWISSKKGLYMKISGDSLITKFSGFPFESVQKTHTSGFPLCVFESETGDIWLGTSKGLYQKSADSDNFNHALKNNKLIGHSPVYDILEDNSNNLWLSTKEGLVSFNYKAVDSVTPKLFDISDGLPFEGFTYTPLFQSKDGRIFVPGRGGRQNGFFYFHPDSVTFNQHIPPVFITNLIINNKEYVSDSMISCKKDVVLPYDKNHLYFEFSALDFQDPGENQYAYQMQGIDDQWIYCNSRRFVTYPSLPPGKYVFRVKASNNDGYWNNNGNYMAVTILPPPWRTWWAYTIYAILLSGIIIAWRRYDLKRQLLKRELELEHIQTEKLEELDRLKSRFFANISHEFRTPLTLILGPLQSLRKSMPDDASKDIDFIERNTLKLKRLINQLLSLSRIESGEMKLKTVEKNLNKVVKDYIQNFESLAKFKNVTLSFRSKDENLTIYLDPEKIETVLYNLLSNSFKFTKSGGQILVETERSGKYAVIIVSDTGCGIPEKDLPNIFNRFNQASNSSMQDGSGIGLALAKEFVELHHGKIEVESKVNEGTSFKILIPLGKDHLKKEEITDAQNDAYEGPGKRGEEFSAIEITDPADYPENVLMDKLFKDEAKSLVLIVEDNPDLRSYIKIQLSPYFEIVEASDGLKGFSKAKEIIPDLILSDVMMPGIDGFELCEKTKTDERTSHIPVILLTAKAGHESKLEGLENGADDFLTKPFDPEELRVRIQNLINGRQRLREKYLSEIGTAVISRLKNDRNLSLESLDSRFLKRAKSVVEEHLSDTEFDITAFSEAMNLSRTQVHRKLKAIVGLSSTEFIRNIRLYTAAELLKHKTGNISEVAMEVGFNNPAYFSKSFRKLFGMLPSEYIKLKI